MRIKSFRPIYDITCTIDYAFINFVSCLYFDGCVFCINASVRKYCLVMQTDTADGSE